MSNGCAVELTEGCTVSVDHWTRRNSFQACFLTHAHTDHTKGLSDTWPGPDIHCTEQTKRFILNKWPSLENKIVTVAIGEAVDLCLTSSSEEQLCITVTPIDARHCPGSVMYLFEGTFGRILHTGDFRWEVIDGCLDVPDVLLNGPIDRIYLDNTYCNPEYKFPPRASELKRIVDIVKQNPEFRVVIGMDSLGKEEIVEEVSRVAGEAVGVAESRVEAFRIAGIPEECFTTDMENARITVIPKWTVRQDDLAATTPPTIGIVPSALFNSSYRFPTKIPTDSWKKQQLRVTVPYSLHCCYSEIEAFVAILRPRELVGIVKASRDFDIDPMSHLHHLLADMSEVDQCGQAPCPTDEVARGGEAENRLSKSVELHGERNPLPIKCHSSEPIMGFPSTSLGVNQLPPDAQEHRSDPIDLAATPLEGSRSEENNQSRVGVRGVKMGGAGVVSKRSWRARFTRPQRSALKIVPQGCTQDNLTHEDETHGCAPSGIAQKGGLCTEHPGVVGVTWKDGSRPSCIDGIKKEEEEGEKKEEVQEEEEEIVPNPHKVVWSSTDKPKHSEEAIKLEC